MSNKPKVALVSDEKTWGCGGGKYYEHVLRILGDEGIGLRLRHSKKTEISGRVKNIHTSLLESELEGVEQIWFGAVKNEYWKEISDVVLKHPSKKLAIHNMENMASRYMKSSHIYESEIKWDLQLIQREAMRKIFQDAWPTLNKVDCVLGHATLEPEELSVYDTITYEEKLPLVVAPSRWSSYKRSTQTVISLWSAFNEGVKSEMWGVKSIGLDMSQFHMLNAEPEFKKIWDDFVEKECVKGKYEQHEKANFLRRALLDIDFTTISGKNRVYVEDAHPQFVNLEAVAYRSIPVVCSDAFDDKLDKGYYRIDVPRNGADNLIEGSIATGKEMARLIKSMTKDEWEHKTSYNMEVLKRSNSWEGLTAAVEECKERLSK